MIFGGIPGIEPYKPFDAPDEECGEICMICGGEFDPSTESDVCEVCLDYEEENGE